MKRYNFLIQWSTVPGLSQIYLNTSIRLWIHLIVFFFFFIWCPLVYYFIALLNMEALYYYVWIFILLWGPNIKSPRNSVFKQYHHITQTVLIPGKVMHGLQFSVFSQIFPALYKHIPYLLRILYQCRITIFLCKHFPYLLKIFY